MSPEQRSKIVLTGYVDDLNNLVPQIAAPPIDMFLVDQNALGSRGEATTKLPYIADVVIFVLSINSCYSTRFRALFVYVYDSISSPYKYLMLVGDVDLNLIYPEIIHLPKISIKEINKLLENLSSD